jgi:hypothetical protein
LKGHELLQWQIGPLSPNMPSWIAQVNVPTVWIRLAENEAETAKTMCQV